MRIPRILGRIRTIALGLFAVGALGQATAWGQYQSTDPYDPYNALYRPFAYPSYGNPALPNQNRLGIIGGGDPGSVTSIDGADGLFGRGQGRLEGLGVPSVRPGGDSYVPNAGDTFYEEQAERQKLYFEALNEKDRRKRAELLRKYRELSSKAARGASPSAVRGAQAREAQSKRSGAETAPRTGGPSLGGTAATSPDGLTPRQQALLRRLPGDRATAPSGRPSLGPRLPAPRTAGTPLGSSMPAGAATAPRTGTGSRPTDILNRALTPTRPSTSTRDISRIADPEADPHRTPPARIADPSPKPMRLPSLDPLELPPPGL